MATAAQFTTGNGAGQSSTAQPDQLKLNDGSIAPLDHGDPDKQQDQGYGPNNERLEEMEPEVVGALWQLIRSYYMEGIVGRRHEIRKIKQARLFWQGLQYLTGWDVDNMDWRLPFGSGQGLAIEEDEDEAFGGRYQFVTNLYQAFGLSFIALISQGPPTVNWYPQSAQNEDDITFAKAASDIAELIQENNIPEDLLKVIGFYLWCDGVVGTYSRFVSDGSRFGFHDVPQMELADTKLGTDYFQCPNCDAQLPATGSQYENCRECGTGMGPAEFQQAPSAKVPRVTAVNRQPNGQEVISVWGGLEINRPIYVDDPVMDGAYIGLQFEVHEAKLRAAYPHVKDKILSGTPADAEDVYARASRLAIKQGLPTTHPGDALRSLTTTSLYWIEPWAFYTSEVKDDVRQKLLKLFPDGCYVCFAGQQYCESRNESKKDHWRILQPLPGDGQNRPAVGTSLISVQERYNIMSNIAQESYEYGVPPIFADPQVIDFDALEDQTAEPATYYPARARPGQALAKGFFQLEPTGLPADAIQYMTDLFGAISQFLTGMFPSMFGGEMEDVKTASGYAMARDQALGRLGLYWRGIKTLWAGTMQLGVECFRKNRTQDVERAVLGADGGYESKVISVGDLRGNIQARPEADETFPRLKSQQRAALMQLMALNDPAVEQALTEPANMELIKTLSGLSDFVLPGEDSRNKQLREIQQLLQGQPMQVPGPIDPATGLPGQSPTLQPSVPIDVFDRHEIELEEGVRWINAPEGQEAKETNPPGFANVKAHLMAHQAAIQAKAAGASAQKPPSESINFKDLPPDGQAQMAGQAGIKLDPMALMAKQQQDKADKAAELKMRLGNASKNKEGA